LNKRQDWAGPETAGIVKTLFAALSAGLIGVVSGVDRRQLGVQFAGECPAMVTAEHSFALGPGGLVVSDAAPQLH
jgi:hypothetical protein